MPRVGAEAQPAGSPFEMTPEQQAAWDRVRGMGAAGIRMLGAEPVTGAGAELAGQVVGGEPFNWNQMMLAAALGTGPKLLGEGAKLARESKVVEKVLDPMRPVDTIKYLLHGMNWEAPTGKYLERVERPLNPTQAELKKIAKYESSMYRKSNIGKGTFAFEEVEKFVPGKAPYYRKELAEIDKLQRPAGPKGLFAGEKASDPSVPMPREAVDRLKSLLEEYHQDLIDAGHK